jgi:hypothetical protein
VKVKLSVDKFKIMHELATTLVRDSTAYALDIGRFAECCDYGKSLFAENPQSPVHDTLEPHFSVLATAVQVCI